MNRKIVEILKNNDLTLTTCESVTGGNIISKIIEVPGASKVVSRAFVVYSDEAKVEVLGVDENIIKKYGVVSEEVVLEMAKKAKDITNTNIAISTSGEAGPVVNETGIEVGTVCFSIIYNDKEHVKTIKLNGNRSQIISGAVKYILNYLYDIIK